MIFHEIYGSYYQAVAEILKAARQGHLTEAAMYELAARYAFAESGQVIVPALREERWPLLTRDFRTPLQHTPYRLPTTLEKRWLKTVLQDPRVQLFAPDVPELEAVEPLYRQEDLVYFDRYLDGDPFEDPAYQNHFRLILQAVRQHRRMIFHFQTGHGGMRSSIYCPLALEYSDKDDKFRVLCAGNRQKRTVNMGRITGCTLLKATFPAEEKIPEQPMGKVVFRLKDTRRALERAMLQFSHFKKQVTRLDDGLYQVALAYDLEDETDVVIQLLSFGRYVTVLEPERLRQELGRRIRRQVELFKADQVLSEN